MTPRPRGPFDIAGGPFCFERPAPRACCPACRRTSTARKRSGSEDWQVTKPIPVSLKSSARWRRRMMRSLWRWRPGPTTMGAAHRRSRPLSPWKNGRASGEDATAVVSPPSDESGSIRSPYQNGINRPLSNTGRIYSPLRPSNSWRASRRTESSKYASLSRPASRAALESSLTCSLIRFEARSKRSNQRPDTLMQDRSPPTR